MKAPTDYEIYGLLGTGAFGQVYRAKYKGSRDCAVKFFNRGRFDAARLQRELSILEKVRFHDRVVYVLGFDLTGDAPWYAMDLCEGDMDSLCGKLTRERCEALLREIASALAYCHLKDVVHCDIKPRNVLLTTDESGVEHVKLCDFGQSRSSSETRIELSGTAFYASPEQLRDPGNSRRKGWDVYSFGVLAYRLATGRYPRLQELDKPEPAPKSDDSLIHDTEKDVFNIARLIEEEAGNPISWPDEPPLDADWRALVEQCLCIAPDERPPDMREVFDGIKAIEEKRKEAERQRVMAIRNAALEEAKQRVIAEREAKEQAQRAGKEAEQRASAEERGKQIFLGAAVCLGVAVIAISSIAWALKVAVEARNKAVLQLGETNSKLETEIKNSESRRIEIQRRYVEGREAASQTSLALANEAEKNGEPSKAVALLVHCLRVYPLNEDARLSLLRLLTETDFPTPLREPITIDKQWLNSMGLKYNNPDQADGIRGQPRISDLAVNESGTRIGVKVESLPGILLDKAGKLIKILDEQEASSSDIFFAWPNEEYIVCGHPEAEGEDILEGKWSTFSADTGEKVKLQQNVLNLQELPRARRSAIDYFETKENKLNTKPNATELPAVNTDALVFPGTVQTPFWATTKGNIVVANWRLASGDDEDSISLGGFSIIGPSEDSEGPLLMQTWAEVEKVSFSSHDDFISIQVQQSGHEPPPPQSEIYRIWSGGETLVPLELPVLGAFIPNSISQGRKMHLRTIAKACFADNGLFIVSTQPSEKFDFKNDALTGYDPGQIFFFQTDPKSLKRATGISMSPDNWRDAKWRRVFSVPNEKSLAAFLETAKEQSLEDDSKSILLSEDKTKAVWLDPKSRTLNFLHRGRDKHIWPLPQEADAEDRLLAVNYDPNIGLLAATNDIIYFSPIKETVKPATGDTELDAAISDIAKNSSATPHLLWYKHQHRDAFTDKLLVTFDKSTSFALISDDDIDYQDAVYLPSFNLKSDLTWWALGASKDMTRILPASDYLSLAEAVGGWSYDGHSFQQVSASKFLRYKSALSEDSGSNFPSVNSETLAFMRWLVAPKATRGQPPL